MKKPKIVKMPIKALKDAPEFEKGKKKLRITKKSAVARNPYELAKILGLDPSVAKEWIADAKKALPSRKKK